MFQLHFPICSYCLAQQMIKIKKLLMMLLGATTRWRNDSKRLAEGTAGTGPVLSERATGAAPDRARDPYRRNEVLDHVRRAPFRMAHVFPARPRNDLKAKPPRRAVRPNGRSL